MTLFVILVLAALCCVNAQSTCDGTPLPNAQSLAARYPTPLKVASLVPGDANALELYNAILAKNSSLLNIAPTLVQNGSFVQNQPALQENNCWWSATTCTTPDPSTGLSPDYSFCPSGATWGLSIDDGPTCYHGALYDMLAQQNQLASLYYIGSNVLAQPLEAQRGFLAGHEICVHTWSHQYSTSLSNEQIFAELYYTKQLIKEVTGYSSRCYRSPYGDTDNRVRFFAAALDMKIHAWSQNVNDWQVGQVGPAAIEQNYQTIINNAKSSTSGIIVLTHEVDPATCGLLIQEYPNIAHNFNHVVPVSTCQNNTDIFAEDGAPSFVNFADYVNNQRGDARTNSSFWSTADIVYVNGTAADFYDRQNTTAQSSASATLATSASATAQPTASNLPARVATQSRQSSSAFPLGIPSAGFFLITLALAYH